MSFILRRLGFYLLAFWAALTLDFILPRLLPGDPVASLIAGMGSRLNAAQITALREALGLIDEPLIIQYFTYLSHALRGDFGISYSSFPAPVSAVIGTGLMWTVLLGLCALIVSFILGHIIGIFAAWWRGSLLDKIAPALLNFIGAFPPFFLALLAVYVLGLTLQWFPTSHAYESGLEPGLNFEFLASVLHHMVLPLFVVILVTIGPWTQGMRNVMIGVLAEDYITMAEAKGLRQNRIMLNYAARNAMLPSVTGFGIFLGFILSGQVLIEQVFAYPGLGFLLVRAVGSRDYPLVQGLFIMITIAVLVANFMVDILYTRLDPRVSRG
ncbi:ABC transporter permease [uncultured Cohaesibacter sp.]|uniref:ABC transporter permease n=1 Tax=uncultured Cohaesibacter sp. TaxID=1002546 RepID=UPI00293086A1|nr:ABC transporter permease [uncultured Cohaesibacter sp.]